jgi:hypothetical protein
MVWFSCTLTLVSVPSRFTAKMPVTLPVGLRGLRSSHRAMLTAVMDEACSLP